MHLLPLTVSSLSSLSSPFFTVFEAFISLNTSGCLVLKWVIIPPLPRLPAFDVADPLDILVPQPSTWHVAVLGSP